MDAAAGCPPAPRLHIPSRAVSAVEHPCIVKNIDKAIASLGGPAALSTGLRSKLEPQTNEEGDDELPKLLSLSLRPDDPLAKRLLATPVYTNNLLLKVTVPKRTGRKRKRGSAGPFVADDHAGTRNSTYVDAATMFRSLRDNATKYDVAVAGMIDETHRFRNLPDIQYAASTNSTMASIRDHILPFNYSKLKEFKINTAAGPDLAKDVGPSAEFIQMPVAYNYRFQQNTFVKYTDDSRGEVNLQRILAVSGYRIIKPLSEEVPLGPKPNLPPETDLTPYLQTLIENIRAQLNRRPIITRHMLYNKLGWDKRDKIRQAAVYCGYFFETGPWRETLIKWGLDPRKDPDYRKYQTVSFLSYKKTGTARHSTAFDQHVRDLARMQPRELEDQHIFDGVNVSNTGNLFQFCDITDPLIRRILDTKNIRSTCAPTAQGWYHIGTWAKATVILKDKMNTIIGGETPDNSIYERIVAWPEIWNDDELYATYKPEYYDRQIRKEKEKEHTVMRTVRWAARNPRYAFEKMEALQLPSEDRGDPSIPEEEMEVPEDMTEEPDTAVAILNESDNDTGEGDYEGGQEEEEEEEEEEEGEGDGDDGIDGEWEADGDYDSDTLAPATREGTEGPLPFGGLFNR